MGKSPMVAMCWFLYNKLEESYIDLVRDTLKVVFDNEIRWMKGKGKQGRNQNVFFIIDKVQFRNLV